MTKTQIHFKGATENLKKWLENTQVNFKNFRGGGLKCAHLGRMSARIPSRLGRDFVKINYFIAQF